MVEWSCTKEKINERRPYILVEWSCTKERLNKREPYVLVQCSCAIKGNNSVGTLNFGRMVVHIASAKIMEREGSISPYSFIGKCSTVQNSPMELLAFSQNSFVISPGLLHDLIRRENKLLAKETFISNTIVFLKQ